MIHSSCLHQRSRKFSFIFSTWMVFFFFFGIHTQGGDLVIRSSDGIDTLLCNHCKGIYRRARRQSAPEWQARWAHWIFEQVKDRPERLLQPLAFQPVILPSWFACQFLCLRVLQCRPNMRMCGCGQSFCGEVSAMG
ncbi:hypothetical protein RSAG8_08192, partial [Rhizoctonia solani AG-8 WAC10335]